jgi:hypothetical protein
MTEHDGKEQELVDVLNQVVEGKEKEEPKPKAKPKAKKKEKIKPYVHIDTFLLTAVPLYSLTRVQAQGFKALMNGSHYQRDEKVFLNKLKTYLNLK